MRRILAGIAPMPALELATEGIPVVKNGRIIAASFCQFTCSRICDLLPHSQED